ncbi:hypothetical protein CRE_20831 [Caenorhabditis remanei]|uniref:Uncharacterized protein n=1 Tax=Caenorhabditis remanei TaxID=31234 RepID=E3MV13_CAERE|nr:hypothetical protein CRE_20831 [Caenorhabditis remanei]
MSCVFENTFLESDRFLSYVLHGLTSIEVPIHLFGVYLIIFKTPKTMKSAKNSILQLHILCSIMDLMMNSLLSFYIFMPSPGGFPTGFMTTLGINPTCQTFLAFSSMLAVALSFISFFENRYDVIVIGQIGRSCKRNIFRILYFAANVVYVELTMAYIFWHLPSVEEGRKVIFETLPCIPAHLVNNPFFIHLNARLPIIPTLSSTMILVIFAQGLYFVIYTSYHLFSAVENVSKHTRSIQQKFFVAMLLQASIPTLLFFAPLICYYMIWRLFYYNQVYNNLLMIAAGCNGLFNTIVMILVHHPYRNAVKEMLWMRTITDNRTTFVATLRPIVDQRELVAIDG